MLKCLHCDSRVCTERTREMREMVKRAQIEMSEGTYATLWSAIVKTGDDDALSLLKEVARQQTVPVLHYTMEKELLFGFVDDIVKSGDVYHANMILKNSHNSGYFRKHYTFPLSF